MGFRFGWEGFYSRATSAANTFVEGAIENSFNVYSLLLCMKHQIWDYDKEPDDAPNLHYWAAGIGVATSVTHVCMVHLVNEYFRRRREAQEEKSLPDASHYTRLASKPSDAETKSATPEHIAHGEHGHAHGSFEHAHDKKQRAVVVDLEAEAQTSPENDEKPEATQEDMQLIDQPRLVVRVDDFNIQSPPIVHQDEKKEQPKKSLCEKLSSSWKTISHPFRKLSPCDQFTVILNFPTHVANYAAPSIAAIDSAPIPAWAKLTLSSCIIGTMGVLGSAARVRNDINILLGDESKIGHGHSHGAHSEEEHGHSHGAHSVEEHGHSHGAHSEEEHDHSHEPSSPEDKHEHSHETDDEARDLFTTWNSSAEFTNGIGSNINFFFSSYDLLLKGVSGIPSWVPVTYKIVTGVGSVPLAYAPYVSHNALNDFLKNLDRKKSSESKQENIVLPWHTRCVLGLDQLVHMFDYNNLIITVSSSAANLNGLSLLARTGIFSGAMLVGYVGSKAPFDNETQAMEDGIRQRMRA